MYKRVQQYLFIYPNDTFQNYGTPGHKTVNINYISRFDITKKKINTNIKHD